MLGHDAIDARAPVKNWRYSIERHDDRSQIGSYRIHDFFGASCSMAHIPNGRRDLSGIWDRGTAPGAPVVAPAGFGAPPAPGPRPFQNLPSLLPDGLPF